MNIVRAGRSFDVSDDPISGAWGFWQEHFAKEWERSTFDVIDKALTNGGDYVDVGAWVGPLVLWAAPLARQVIAVEPDPVAFQLLKENVTRNALKNVLLLRGAVSHDYGEVQLECGKDWGDSTSSVITSRGNEKIAVPAVPLSLVLAGLDPALVKIDIEGAEGIIIPANVGVLHELVLLGCTILVSLHWPWMDPQHKNTLSRALHGFTVTTIDETDRDFPVVVLS